MAMVVSMAVVMAVLVLVGIGGGLTPADPDRSGSASAGFGPSFSKVGRSVVQQGREVKLRGA